MRACFALLIISALALPEAAAAQSVVYQAPTGSVASTLVMTMNLTGGGTAVLVPVVGPNCYLGQTCNFPAGYAGSQMSYTLPSGVNATLTRFAGQFKPMTGSNAYELTGRASGKDSAGHQVIVSNILVTMTITCNRGCSKTYTGGHLRLKMK